MRLKTVFIRKGSVVARIRFYVPAMCLLAGVLVNSPAPVSADPEPPEQQRARLQRDLATIERELENLSALAAAGGAASPTTLLKSMREREQRRSEIHALLARLDLQTSAARLDPKDLRAKIAAVLTDWRGLAAKHVSATRQLLRKLLVSRVTFAPDADAGAGVIRFRGEGTLAPIIGRLELQQLPAVVAPTGFEPVFQP